MTHATRANTHDFLLVGAAIAAGQGGQQAVLSQTLAERSEGMIGQNDATNRRAGRNQASQLMYSVVADDPFVAVGL